MVRLFSERRVFAFVSRWVFILRCFEVTPVGDLGEGGVKEDAICCFCFVVLDVLVWVRLLGWIFSCGMVKGRLLGGLLVAVVLVVWFESMIVLVGVVVVVFVVVLVGVAVGGFVVMVWLVEVVPVVVVELDDGVLEFFPWYGLSGR